MRWSVIIVDDEAPARKRLSDLLRDELDFRVAAHCPDGIAALEQLRREVPDLIFLDVQMPELSGFDVARALPPGVDPALIFTTAHSEHALQAFGVNALDYLLKPYSKARFRQALVKARTFLKGRRTHASSPVTAQSRRLVIKDGSRVVFVPFEDIDWIEAEGNYAAIHAGTATHLLRTTLHSLENQLPRDMFTRASRSALVNRARIREIHELPGGNRTILLHTGHRVHLTRALDEL